MQIEDQSLDIDISKTTDFNLLDRLLEVDSDDGQKNPQFWSAVVGLTGKMPMPSSGLTLGLDMYLDSYFGQTTQNWSLNP